MLDNFSSESEESSQTSHYSPLRLSSAVVPWHHVRLQGSSSGLDVWVASVRGQGRIDVSRVSLVVAVSETTYGVFRLTRSTQATLTFSLFFLFVFVPRSLSLNHHLFVCSID